MNEGKYFFNGKDITMNICIQIWDVIDIIQEKQACHFLMQLSHFIIPKHIRLCRIQKTRSGQSPQDILLTVTSRKKKQNVMFKHVLRAAHLLFFILPQRMHSHKFAEREPYYVYQTQDLSTTFKLEKRFIPQYTGSHRYKTFRKNLHNKSFHR